MNLDLWIPAKKPGFWLKTGFWPPCPSAEYLSLLPYLETVSLPFKQVLYKAKEPIEQVYFPNNGVISLLTNIESGTLAEVGLVGLEGMTGLPRFLGVETTPLQAIVQVPGDAMRMQADVFKDLLNRGSSLHSLLRRYTQALMLQISQSAACNCHHSVSQRCCRWLLMTHDRVSSDSFPLTHQFLSQMLGVRRASVTIIAGRLQQAGLIAYSRGQITILERIGLEAAACGFYELIKQEEDRLRG